MCHTGVSYMKSEDLEKIRVKDIKFKPVLDEKSNWYTMGIYLDDVLCGFLHWIESSDGSIVHIDQAQFAKKICETKETADSMCEQIQEMYNNGEVGSNL